MELLLETMAMPTMTNLHQNLTKHHAKQQPITEQTDRNDSRHNKGRIKSTSAIRERIESACPIILSKRAESTCSISERVKSAVAVSKQTDREHSFTGQKQNEFRECQPQRRRETVYTATKSSLTSHGTAGE